MHEKTIEIRWCDLDADGHVNGAVYLNYLEEARDEWLARALGSSGSGWDYVVARIAVDFLSKLCQEDDVVVVRCFLASLGASSVTLREEIVTREGRLAANAQATLVAYDRQSGTSRRLSEGERQCLEREVIEQT